MMNLYEKLKFNIMFKNFTCEEIEKLIDYDACILGQYNKNTLIIQEHDKCNAIGLILDGEVSVHQFLMSGENITVKKLKTGDSFGEGVLYTKSRFYHYNLITEKDTVVFYIPFDQVELMLQKSLKFNKNYITFMANRLLLFKRKIDILSQKDVRSRLLIYFHDEQERKGSNDFKLSHTKTEIADIITVARPSISRELKAMQDDGLIELDRNYIKILKPEAFHIFSSKNP